MKRYFWMGTLGFCFAIRTQADATITFANRNIPTVEGLSTYSVPIWQYGHLNQPGFGAGSLPGGVTVGLFIPGAASPLLNTSGQPALATLRTDSNGQVFSLATASQTVIVTGVTPGQRAQLEVRAWQGPSFDAAIANGLQFGSWLFTSKPLGGIDNGGQVTFTPSMTGWGPESGAGLTLVVPVPEPGTIALVAIGVGALAVRWRRAI